MSIDQQIARIQQKINELDLHLNPCLTSRKVTAFEKKHGITLPEEYRRFLMEIGNGGQGNGFGLMQLGVAPASRGPEDVKLWSELPLIKEPFPFEKEWCWDHEPDEEWSDEKYARIHHGNLLIASGGCGTYWLLIVTGPQRGEIWSLVDMGIFPDSGRRDFLTWYEESLDDDEKIF